jgi:toxin-antitoxin system PIN domain toxin
MSYSVDVNILIYALNSDSELHSKAASFVEHLAGSNETWAMPWPTVHAFLRITTHTGILMKPLTPDSSWDAIGQIISLPQVRLIDENHEEFRDYYEHLTRSMHLRGNAIPDGHLAALLHVHGVSVFYSNDRDFLKFKGIKTINPLR